MTWEPQATEEQFSEPILAKKDAKVEIQAATSDFWTVKESVPSQAGQQTKCMKLTVKILSEDVQTEHEEALPKLLFDQTFNIEPHPYLSKKTGSVEQMRPGLLYSLEEALGFAPIYLDADGNTVEPVKRRDGSLGRPNRPGIRRQLNPEFRQAYFTEDGSPNLEWTGKVLRADIELEAGSEAYAPKNKITRFKALPSV